MPHHFYVMQACQRVVFICILFLCVGQSLSYKYDSFVCGIYGIGNQISRALNRVEAVKLITKKNEKKNCFSVLLLALYVCTETSHFAWSRQGIKRERERRETKRDSERQRERKKTIVLNWKSCETGKNVGFCCRTAENALFWSSNTENWLCSSYTLGLIVNNWILS